MQPEYPFIIHFQRLNPCPNPAPTAGIIGHRQKSLEHSGVDPVE